MPRDAGREKKERRKKRNEQVVGKREVETCGTSPSGSR